MRYSRLLLDEAFFFLTSVYILGQENHLTDLFKKLFALKSWKKSEYYFFKEKQLLIFQTIEQEK